VSAIRAEQSTHRARASVLGWDAKFELVKVNPLLRWTKRDVWAFIVAHGVPYNPLHDHGYPSIGCWPCTRAVGAGETDERAGRWAGQAKTECGLHSMDSSQL
jgi:phosphoadenosine phosphosulfate reductase